MADSSAFLWACAALEEVTSLNRIEARGTVRIVLKSGGLDARKVDTRQMQVVLEKVLPDELALRGVEDAASICSELARRLGAENLAGDQVDTTHSVFERLGGGL